MLRFTATDDKKLLGRLYEEIFGEEFDRGVGYVLYDGDKPIGIAKMTVRPQTSVLEKVGILPEERGKGNGDFFTRSLIWGMSNVSEEIAIAQRAPYYEKFGFRSEGEIMTCRSSDVVFPCGCHK